MASSTVENYIKQLYMAQQKSTRPLVSMGHLARKMQVTPGTATTMVKALEDAGLVEYTPRQGVRLSSSGKKLALLVLRRHRLIELFLVKVLGLDWTEVHSEAEVLEHVISDRILDRMDVLLGHPETDPHGDPIPDLNGEVGERNLQPLSKIAEGEQVRIARISNQDPKYLRFIEQSGLLPGKCVEVTSVDQAADAITVKPRSSKRVNLGMGAAGSILVTQDS